MKGGVKGPNREWSFGWVKGPNREWSFLVGVRDQMGGGG